MGYGIQIAESVSETHLPDGEEILGFKPPRGKTNNLVSEQV